MTMTFEQMQEVLSSMTQANLGLYERQNRIEREMNDTREIVDRSSENLTRLEAIVESNARAIEAVANKLDEKFDLISKAVIEGQDRLERLERRDKRVDAEIRGLRIETRRMLERWLGEPFTDNPDLDDDED
jgi:chromosome segregation ATPase